MRISRLLLDGYGRFVGRDLEIGQSLQVIVGPNEQGKSTIRNFIGDMLYGQKRSSTQRLYEEAQELRRPWSSPEQYSGRMVYVLDNDHEIEVHRTFDRRQESAQVFDRTLGREITDEFPRLRNRESTFAEHHLGLTKAVFLNTATIDHVSLENLGDTEALSQIREKILSLADSAEEAGTAEAALSLLDARIGSIGRPAARSRPLPQARSRLAELDREHALATAVRQELAEYEARRQELIDALADCRERRSEVESELEAIEGAERRQRLHDAEQCAQEIDDATQRCFTLSGVRDFPVEQEPELQRLINVLNTARTQLRRTEDERVEIQRQLDAERERLGPDVERALEDISEETEARLADLEARMSRLSERLEQAEAERGSAQERLESAQKDLASLPDFSRMAAAPVEWLTQLASTFQMQRQTRDREQGELRRMREEAGRRQAALAHLDRVFAPFRDFPAEANEYKVAVRLAEEKSAELRSQAEQLQITVEDRVARVPRLATFAAGCTVAMAICAAAAYLMHNWIVYVPAGLFGTATFYFTAAAIAMRRSAGQAWGEQEATQARIGELQEETSQRRKAIDAAVSQAGYGSVRELEALHEHWTRERGDVESLRKECATLEARVHDETEQVNRLFGDLRETFRGIGLDAATEDDVHETCGAAISRYQEFRDAKRRVADNLDLPRTLATEADRMRAELASVQTEERDLSLEVRRFMRNQGFVEESRHTSALKATRAYRVRSSQVREKRARMEVLDGNLAAVLRQQEAERQDLGKQEEALSRFLRGAGADSSDQWRELAGQAREYRAQWDRRAALEDKMNALLQGSDLDTLRAQVNTVVAASPAPVRTKDEIKTELERINQTLEDLQKEHHGLDLRITERAASVRPVNDIEEERGVVARRVDELGLELEAAAHAASVIEEVANDRHALIAPHLAATAGDYLAQITDGVYRELFLSRDLRITVRIPQTEQLNENPERRLSTGTVNQIYLALRLALVGTLSKSGENVPMLLDDPFAYYDDDRLARAIGLLTRIAEKTQILLFTCHDDVARSAEEAGASILAL